MKNNNNKNSFSTNVYYLGNVKLRKFHNDCFKTVGDDRFLIK